MKGYLSSFGGATNNGELGESRVYSAARYIRIVEVTGSNPVCSTTIRPKTQFSDGYFMHNAQKQAAIQPKIAKQRGISPQNSAIFLIFGIAILR